MTQSHRLDAREPSTRAASPVFRVRLPAAMAEREIATVVASLDKLLAQSGPHLVICEIDDEVNATAAARRTLARALAERAGPIANGVRAFAFVARTPASQGLHTALRWMTPAACPERRFTTTAEAEDWARTQLVAETRR